MFIAFYSGVFFLSVAIGLWTVWYLVARGFKKPRGESAKKDATD